jgi:hypothetical protein
MTDWADKKAEEIFGMSGSDMSSLAKDQFLKWLAEELRQIWIDAYDKGWEGHEHGR